MTPDSGTSRDRVIEALDRRGIGTSVHFIPVHQLSGYARALGQEECQAVPVTDQIAEELLSLPMYPALTDADVAHVADALLALTRPGARPAMPSEGGEGAELAGLSA